MLTKKKRGARKKVSMVETTSKYRKGHYLKRKTGFMGCGEKECMYGKIGN